MAEPPAPHAIGCWMLGSYSLGILTGFALAVLVETIRNGVIF